jgi:hypothetical protein
MYNLVSLPDGSAAQVAVRSFNQGYTVMPIDSQSKSLLRLISAAAALVVIGWHYHIAVLVQPEPQALANVSSSLPTFTLLGGLLMSALLAGALYQTQTARRGACAQTGIRPACTGWRRAPARRARAAASENTARKPK